MDGVVKLKLDNKEPSCWMSSKIVLPLLWMDSFKCKSSILNVYRQLLIVLSSVKRPIWQSLPMWSSIFLEELASHLKEILSAPPS